MINGTYIIRINNQTLYNRSWYTKSFSVGQDT